DAKLHPPMLYDLASRGLFTLLLFYGYRGSYFEKVKHQGLTEHGFARLTSDIGILLCHSIRSDLLPLFLEMMDFCCENVPRCKAANDFSVRELLSCLAALQKAQTVPCALIQKWKSNLGQINPETCYTVWAKAPEDEIFNWALFSASSEFMRQSAGLCESGDFIETQIASQVKWLDENGMYRDAKLHPPMLYDLASRGLFTLLLFYGYRGSYFETIDAALRKAALCTLAMQSVSGEIAFGGRSNQFLFNEAWMAVIFEYEARRYGREGNAAQARIFKGAAVRAIDALERWIMQEGVCHVKNRFPVETRYGCESYAYFDKYMITVASVLHDVYLVCDESIEADMALSPACFQSSAHFHKLFLRTAGYALEFDTNADPHYDASGLGRVHKKGAPAPLCLSVPCPSQPNYALDLQNPPEISICTGVLTNEGWQFATNIAHEVLSAFACDSLAQAELLCRFADGQAVRSKYTVTEDGITVDVLGENEVALLLPAFHFDGAQHTEIIQSDQRLSVAYGGWVCYYETDGALLDLKQTGGNRHGHYRAFCATASKRLQVRICISKQQ
ncbi:MAG: hypothetical protein J6R40_04305, partial [Clostridia bacterium]|nr:hypothetical protein [Clostridia bacterium]